jgi:hypothetical protein
MLDPAGAEFGMNSSSRALLQAEARVDGERLALSRARLSAGSSST